MFLILDSVISWVFGLCWLDVGRIDDRSLSPMVGGMDRLLALSFSVSMTLMACTIPQLYEGLVFGYIILE